MDAANDEKSPAEMIIERMGGLTKLARALGYPVSTVQGWKDRRSIPQDHWLSIMQAAKSAGVVLALEDFFTATPAEAAE